MPHLKLERPSNPQHPAKKKFQDDCDDILMKGQTVGMAFLEMRKHGLDEISAYERLGDSDAVEVIQYWLDFYVEPCIERYLGPAFKFKD